MRLEFSRALQSSMFQNPGGVPRAWHTHKQTQDKRRKSLCLIVKSSTVLSKQCKCNTFVNCAAYQSSVYVGIKKLNDWNQRNIKVYNIFLNTMHKIIPKSKSMAKHNSTNCLYQYWINIFSVNTLSSDILSVTIMTFATSVSLQSL